MFITYDDFCELIEEHINGKEKQNFYLTLLEKVIKNPTRFCGLFRLSNAKTKLLQNITHSKEIKFGDIIEEVTTIYISKMGYQNLEKKLINDNKSESLHADQFFTDGENLYIVEMKIRDDHDSSKKRGQLENFLKKIDLVKLNYNNTNINAIMWFVDDKHTKNRKYYKEELNKKSKPNCNIFLYYGAEFFKTLKNGKESWNELTELITKYREDNSNIDISVPDFGSSDKIYEALLKLDNKYWKKLNSNNTKYKALREELFSEGDNLSKAEKARSSNAR